MNADLKLGFTTFNALYAESYAFNDLALDTYYITYGLWYRDQ